ncbi:MAG TPA: biliverdin-producing heme oxygenase [Polyangia bacterium]|jgi:heme oxygenase|nr:biliverdin-producing heme oxygenase [Polyangia bacterium]
MSAPLHGGSNDARTVGTPSLLHRQLRHETAGLHQRLDERLTLLDPHLSIDRYRQVLQVFLGFYVPVEAGLARLALAAGSPLGFPLRARADLIERDLIALGASPRQIAELPRCADLPRLLSLEDLAGCVYVLEGACLGGQVIAPALHRRLGLAKENGASFFIGDAEVTSARWRSVLSWLESLPSAGARSEDIVASACATFSALIEWETRQGAYQEGGRGRPDRL